MYRETWPAVFSKLRRVSQDAEEGVNDLMTRLVCGGMDQWPDPGEAWGELDHCRQMLDFKGFVSELNSVVSSHTLHALSCLKFLVPCQNYTIALMLLGTNWGYIMLGTMKT